MKKKKWVKVVIALSVILALIGGGLLYYFKDMIFNKPQDSELGEYYGLFAYAPVTGGDSVYIDYSIRFSDYSAEIEAGMAEGATAEQKALAAYIIYRIGCLADATAVMRAKYTTGSGFATGAVNLGSTAFDVTGAMNMTASYYSLKYPFEAPASVTDVYDNYLYYEAAEEYTQIPAGGVTGENENIVALGEPFLRSSLPFARRSITTHSYKAVWEADKSTCVITPELATAEFIRKADNFSVKTQSEIDAFNLEKGVTRIYPEDWGDLYGLTAKDLSIHVINPSTILGDTVVITRQTGEDTGGNAKDYYSVEFEIDTVTNRGTADSATYYAEQLYKSQAPDIFINYLQDYHLYYSGLKVSMSVYSNGYFRTWSTDEQWLMSGSVENLASAEITSDNESVEAYCYDYDTIMQGFVNRYFGNLSEVNIPMETLPFYDSNLAGITAQPYGTYR